MAYSYITWPSTLPQSPLVSGYSETLPDYSIITSEFDTGASRQRRRSSLGIEEREATYVLTRDQIKTLKTFWLNNAGRSFWWPDGPTRDYVYARVKGGTKLKINPISDSPDHFQVKLTFEVFPDVKQSTGEV